MQSLRIPLWRALSLAAILAAPLATSAQTLWGLQGTTLVAFDAAAPGTILQTVPLVGVAPTQALVGLDFRPATGELFALAYNATTTRVQLYRVNRTTGQAVGAGAPLVLNLGTATDRIGFDFDPVADNIRVVSTTDANVRLSPLTGALVITDPNLFYAAADAHAGQNPGVGSLTHTNSRTGATSTARYGLDEAQGRLVTVDTTGALQTVTTLSTSLTEGADLDGFTDFNTLTERLYLMASQAGSSALYELNPGTGALTAKGTIGASLTDIAAEIEAPSLVTGQLVYALAGTQLISFDSDRPGTIRDFVAVTGIAPSQAIVGADFRPATGDLYVLGYNASAQQSQLYTLAVATGVATAVGSLRSLNLGTGPDHVGFDFDPLLDRIRITTSARRNYRMNPGDGSVIALGQLTYASGDPGTGQAPAVGAAAYAGSSSSTATFYGYDEARNTLVTQNQTGTLATIGASGLTVNRTTNNVDFDLVYDAINATNVALLAAGTGAATADNLYAIDLNTGTATPLGAIGANLSVSALAIFRRADAILWTGLVSTDWNQSGNWLPLQVPSLANSVVITRTTRQPTISGQATVNSLLLDTTTVVTMLDGSLLTLGGSLVNYYGSLSGTGTAEVRLAGSLPQGIAGTGTQFQNLTIGPAGAVLAGPASVKRLLTLEGDLVATGFPFTLLSDGSSTAMVINHDEAEVVGPVTVQRAVSSGSYAGAAYRHYASPVQRSVVADLATSGFTPVVNAAYNTAANPLSVTPYPNVFGFDETRITSSAGTAGQNFVVGYYSPAAKTDILAPGQGYSVRVAASQKVDFVGQLNNDTLELPSLTRGPQTESGWHLLGNPYPAPIDWTLLFPQTTGLNNAISVWRPTGSTSGVYGTYVNGVAANGGSAIIGAMQGFFVRTTAPNSVGAMRLTNNVRLTTYASPTFRRNTPDPRPLVRLALSGATGPADEAVVYAEAGATAGFDAAFDAEKIIAAGQPQLMLAGATPLAINALPSLVGSIQVPLLLTVPQTGTYTLRATELLNLPTDVRVELLDAATNTTVDLHQVAAYVFTQQAATAVPSTRFTLRLTASGPLGVAGDDLRAAIMLYPNPAHNNLTVTLPSELTRTPCSVQLTDALGRTVRTFAIAAGTTSAQTLSLANLTPGLYVAHVGTSAGITTRRIVVE